MVLEVKVISIPVTEQEKEMKRRTVLLRVENGENEEMFSQKGQELPQGLGKGGQRKAWGQLDIGERSRTGSKRREFHGEESIGDKDTPKYLWFKER